MHRDAGSEKGVGLIEALIAMLVLSVGAIGMAGLFLHGMQAATSSPNELVATQKAAEAIESVYSARDSHTITPRRSEPASSFTSTGTPPRSCTIDCR